MTSRRTPTALRAARFVLPILILLLLLVAPSGAHAYAADGRPWPGGVIRYYQALPASHTWAVNTAARAWNTSGANVRFVRVTNPRRAQLMIRFGPVSSGSAAATLGYRRGAFLHVRRFRRSGRTVATNHQVRYAQLLAHELGHVIGLGHTTARGCQLMDQYLGGCLNTEPRPWLFNCQMLTRDDLRGAIHLYGRRARPRGIRNFCVREAAPLPVRNLSASGGSDGSNVALGWTFARAVRAGGHIDVSVHAAPCGSASNANRVLDIDLGRRATGWSDTNVATRTPGWYCYRVRTVNRFGYGRAAVSRSVSLNSAPPAQPIVNGLTPDPSDETAFSADVTLPTPSTSLVARYAAPGACAASTTAGSPVDVQGFSSPYLLAGIPQGSWCLSLFAVRDGSGVASAGSTLEITNGPR